MAVVNYTVINGEVIAETRSGTRHSYVPDPLGNTICLLSTTQSLTDVWTYWPYGEVKTRIGTTGTPFQYVGTQGYYQDSSSRNYVRARMQRPDLTRWLTQDPIEMLNGSSNPYVYVGNRPTSASDPFGLSPFTACLNKCLAGCIRGTEYDFCQMNCLHQCQNPPKPPPPPPPPPCKGQNCAAQQGWCIAAAAGIEAACLVAATSAIGTCFSGCSTLAPPLDMLCWGFCNRMRIGLYGYCLGAYATLMAACKVAYNRCVAGGGNP